MKRPERPPAINPETLINKHGDDFYEIHRKSDLTLGLEKLDRDHPYWEKFKYRVASNTIAPDLLWYLTKIRRNSTATHLKLDKDLRFQFNLTGPMQFILHQADLQLGGSIRTNSTIPSIAKDQLLMSSLMEEAIASSQLEGAATTRKVAREMLRANREPKNSHERMILNNYRMVKDLVKVKDKPLSIDLIQQMHRTITQGTLEDAMNEGQFRQNDDVAVVDHDTNEIVYYPPGHQQLTRLVKALCRFANDRSNDPFVHPVVRATILHFLMGYIHPFVDGNGRTARALFYWCLLSKGYWMVEYLSISKVILGAKAQYGRAYLHTEYDDNDLTYFVQFNLKALEKATKSLDDYLKRKQQERSVLFQVIKKAPVNERQAEILREFMKDPERLMGMKEVQNLFNVAYQTARTDLLGLEELKYLEHRKAGKKLLFHRSADFDRELSNLDRSQPKLRDLPKG